jgi:Methyltransferase domain
VRIAIEDLRDELRRRLRLALMTTGGRLGERRLTGLRLALSYLEIGHDLSRTGERPVSVADDTDLFELALRRVAGRRQLYLEFGVFEGRTMRWWASHLTGPEARFVGFDSFEGLPEDWHPGLAAGHFATGKPPDIDDPRVSFVVGWFDETLPGYQAPPHDQLILNIDCDLYSSAATALSWAAPLLHPGALAEHAATSPFDFVPIGYARGGVHWLFEVVERAGQPGTAGGT